MAHPQQRRFCESVKAKYPQYFKNKKVLDIGSLDVNGCNRDLFEDCNYIGIDLGEGKNVDIIAAGNTYDGPDNYFDTIISTEVFEHDMFYPQTIQNVMRMLKPGGLFVFTCAATGRPEHGTRRTDLYSAPLLSGVSDEWADYYKNLEKEDIEVINGFKDNFIDGKFSRGSRPDPDDLYFYGIKGGEKYLIDSYQPKYPSNKFPNDIFVIDCWPDNESKENDLIGLIKILKAFNIPILLTGHYPIKVEIQKMVDYYLYDKNNPLLKSEEFDSHQVSSGRWTDMGNHRIDNAHEFHHDYAIWETMRNAFNFCKYLGKEKIHFLEYDNLPDEYQYRQAFLERMNDGFDAVLYEYHENSAKDIHFAAYCATFIFSIKTDVAIRTIEQIKSKHEYFTNKPKGWQLERVFLNCLRNVTNNIHMSLYRANSNELNTQAVWNRDGMFRNGGVFQVYPAVDNQGDLYLHLMSGFHERPVEKDYLLEIVYGSYKKFFNLQKDKFHTEKIGEYRKGDRVKVYYQGCEVFNEFLGQDVKDFRNINKLTWKESKNRRVNVHFIDGPFAEILEDGNNLYKVEFINRDTNQVVYSTNLKSNHWSKAAPRYYINWKIKITGIDTEFNYEHDFNPEGNKVFVCFESKSLGDTLAFMPYVEKFRIDKKVKMVCSTFNNDLYKDQYPEIEFVQPGTNVTGLYAMYRLGLFFKTENGKREVNMSYHPSDPLKISLLQIASDILGLDYVELRPKLKKYGKKKLKRVSIGFHSTAQAKYWNNPTGWQEVVDYLNGKGYEVRLLSKEEDGYMGNKIPTGVVKHPSGPLKDVMKALEESELFIGISSGLSWLSWAVNTPTVIISGFTDKFLEPTNNVERVINKDVCNSCWSNYEFDPGDWNWCPVHKGTDRQFECSKQITSQTVIEAIEKMLK
jgi:autotransporter strand-loop-strand O-heptosyltransferase